MTTTKAILLMDREFDIIELNAYPHLHDLIGAYYDVTWLVGPTTAIHPEHVAVGIAVDDSGLLKQLPMNRLATSLHGVFGLHEYPLVGRNAVVVASDMEGERVDVPEWAIKLVTAIAECTSEALAHVQNPGTN